MGGGLGAVPHQAKLLSEFTPEEELLPQTQAVAWVFARLGEKKNRNRARIKFLVAQLGIEDGKTGLHTLKEIPVHPIGAGAKNARLTAILEIIDSRMLEEAANDGTHSDVL